MSTRQLIGILLIVLMSLPVYAQRNFERVGQQWNTDKENRIVDLDEIIALLPRDRIPPIDDPVYWDIERAKDTYFEHEPVMVVDIEGDARAYPLSVLMWHEIVNDEIGGKPVSVTYCPLCNAAIVFDRRLEHDGEELLLDFGTSGMLRKSDLVMWDRQTETWWQQLNGLGIVGQLAGAELTMVPSLLISFEEFTESYPDGKVLSTETGTVRDYGANPYERYDDLDIEQPRLFDGEVDDRLPAMERVINITVNQEHIIYPLSVIQEEGVINDDPFEKPIVIFHQAGTVSVLDTPDIREGRDVGAVSVFDPIVNDTRLTFQKTDNGFVDKQTGTRWNISGKAVEGELEGEQLSWVFHGNHFAFVWLAFHPESEIFGQID